MLAPIVFGGQVLYWGVPLMQFYPWQHYAAEMWRSGEAPLWNPLLGNGAPLAANLQTGAFDPLNFLYLLAPAEIAMGYTAAMHLVLAGLFMYAYARSIGLRPFSALIAAIAFQLSGYLISRLGFLSITAALPWVAAWLWRAERLMRTGRLLDVMWLAVAVGLGLLAGHAQTSVHGLILLAAYALYRGLSTREWRRVVSASAGVLLGLGLAAIQLVPSAELARESQRVGGLDYTFAMTHSYWPWRLLTLLAPDLFGNPADGDFWGYDNYWENAAYIGVLPLSLAVLAILEVPWSLWKRRARNFKLQTSNFKLQTPTPNPQSLIPNYQSLTLFLASSAILLLILAFGWFTPIYPFLFRTIPGFELFQGPARWLGVFTIALCALAGIGAERMLREPGNLRFSGVWIVIGAAVAVAGLAAGQFLTGRVATFPGATLRLGVLVAIGGLLFGLRPPAGARRFVWWAGAFVAVIALDLLTAHARLNPTIDPALYCLPSSSAEALRASDGRVFMFDDDDAAVRKQYGISLPFSSFGPEGVKAWMDYRATQIPNTSMIDRLASANNFDPLLIGRYLELIEAVNAASFEDALRLLRLMHIRYISSPRDLPLPVHDRTPATTIYRIEEMLPRAWIVHSARLEPDPLPALLDPAFDPLQVVFLAEMPGIALPETSDGSQFTIHALQDTPNAVTIRAASDVDGYLILADTWYPGWRAAIDGQPAPVLRANSTFRAVAFPVGEHTVQFRYEPDSFRAGAWASLACAAIVVAGLALGARRRA
ncbi:MAG TPA: YfhO family protein [Anaerolineae bacterium]|nr:YfhO family protein [Anaerolineae bacterium]